MSEQKMPSRPHALGGDDVFRLVLDSAPDAMIVVDASGTIRYANQQSELLFGYAREELLGRNVDELVKAATPLLPVGTPMFEEDEITDRSERFLASEFLREKLFRLLGDELPYGIAVEIEKFEVEGNLRRIYAAVIVDKPGHKSMVIGRGGEKLKRISSEARVELEKLFDGKVFLEVWVKVKSGWADDERALKSLGYE